MYLNKENTLCFSGHRSEKLPKTDAEMEKLKLRIWEEVDSQGHLVICQYS